MTVLNDLTALCELEARISALTEQRDTLRRRLLDRALDTYENEGAAPTWRAGTLGTVGLTVPKPRLSVFNEDAFAESVLRIAGEGAVEAVVRVKPNVKDALLSAAGVCRRRDGGDQRRRVAGRRDRTGPPAVPERQAVEGGPSRCWPDWGVESAA